MLLPLDNSACMRIGHNLVTWTYLVAKDVAKDSLRPRWSHRQKEKQILKDN